MQKEKNKVSVCVITYNQADYISETLDSILMQKCDFAFEIVIGEDCSQDKTRDICIEYKNKYPDIIKLLLPDKNRGMYTNFIETICHCSGEYIAFCEGDDYWIDPYKLQKQFDFLEANPEYGLIHTKHKIYHQSEDRIEVLEQNKHTGDIFNQLLIDNEMATLTVLARTKLVQSAVEEILVANKHLRALDYPIWLYIARYSKIHYVKDITAVYRKLDESASNSKNDLRAYWFIIGMIDIKIFIAKKYDCLSLILDNVSAYKKRNLKYAYYIGDKEIADQAYKFLKENNKLSLRDKLFYISTTSSLIRSFTQYIVSFKRLIGK